MRQILYEMKSPKEITSTFPRLCTEDDFELRDDIVAWEQLKSLSHTDIWEPDLNILYEIVRVGHLNE